MGPGGAELRLSGRQENKKGISRGSSAFHVSEGVQVVNNLEGGIEEI